MKKLAQLLILLSINFIFAQFQNVTVKNTAINSKYAELGVIYLPNGKVLFASSQKDENDKTFSTNRRKQNSQLFLDLYYGIETNNGNLILDSKFTNELNNKFSESDVTFTPDFKTIYFTWNNFYNTESRKDSANWKTQHIVKASVNENFEISNITYLPFSSDKYSVKNPFVNSKGTQLFFVSDMPDSFGETDIYVVDIYKDGTYGIPKNLGSKVNTKGVELFPFVDANNTLYFTSNGQAGAQSFDIFKSTFENNSYSKIERLPSPFNTEFDDLAFVINKQLNAGYFTSNRKDGIGDVDIYSFSTKEKEKEKIVICEQIIKGLFINEKTNENLDNVEIAVYIDKQLIDKQLINLGNPYSFKLNCNTIYKIISKKENFKPNEFEIKTGNVSGTLNKNIKLSPIECNQTITGLIFDNNTKALINNPKIQLFKNNEAINSQVVATGNRYTFNLDCKENYKMLITNEGYEPFEYSFTTSNINNDILKDFHLTPVECLGNISGLIFDKSSGKQLDNVIASIYLNNKLVTSQNVAIGYKYNFNLNCGNTYKIVFEKEGFNTSEEMIISPQENKFQIPKSVSLSPTKCVQLLDALVINAETGLPLKNATIKIYKINTLIDSLNLGESSKFNYELNCNTNYRIVASLKNYTNAVEILTTNQIQNDQLFRKFNLEENIEFIAVQNQKQIKTKPIYFDLDKDDIRPDAAIELTKVVDILNKYPTIKLEIKSHTDSRAPDGYNMQLSNRRAKSVISYIISKGINESRISGKGYGETQLMNRCSNGVKCSETEHELNRRTEFVVIE